MTLLCDWFKANQLSLNGSKSVGMLFLKTKNKIHSLKVGNIDIKFVDQTKFLGVWIDKKLNLKYHIDKVITKIRQNMNLLHLGKFF